jgi:chorismate mutase
MEIRAIRGAVQITEDSTESMRLGVQELIRNILSENELKIDDLISIFFSGQCPRSWLRSNTVNLRR